MQVTGQKNKLMNIMEYVYQFAKMEYWVNKLRV